MKRLSIPLNEEQHKMIKVAAMLNGQTMKSCLLYTSPSPRDA